MNKTHYLREIIQRKREEVRQLLAHQGAFESHAIERLPQDCFRNSLAQPRLAVIAEIKRRSPSAGLLCDIADPASLALSYCRGGAAAVSVLTDQEGFGGSLDDLTVVVRAMRKNGYTAPVLRKDFLLHPIQLVESVAAGADAVLLIAGVLGADLEAMIQSAHGLGLGTLTEVESMEDLAVALAAKAPVIGVNHRSLKSFEMDHQRTASLRNLIPEGIIAVAESGIKSVEQARHLHQMGYDGVLIGEYLVKATDPASLIAEMKGVVE